MTSYRQLTDTNIIEPLRQYLGNSETTLITSDQYLCHIGTHRFAGSRHPDLLIAFNTDMDAHRYDNGYAIAEQGQLPDFVLEIASARTGCEDSGRKRPDYDGFGIPEYRHFGAPHWTMGRPTNGQRREYAFE